MKRKIIFLFLSVFFFSSCERYSTKESTDLFQLNKSEFQNIFQKFSQQNKIRTISYVHNPLAKGFMKFSIGLFAQNENMGFKTYDVLEINPEYSLKGNLEFDENTINLLEANNLDVNDVTEYCEFVKKFDVYEIYIVGNPFEFGDFFMYKRNTVRFMLNPYQGFHYSRLEGQSPFPNSIEVIDLDSNIFYFSEL